MPLALLCAAAVGASTSRLDVERSGVFADLNGRPDRSGMDQYMPLARKYHLRVLAGVSETSAGARWVMFIPGGGWKAADASAVRATHPFVAFVRQHGWATSGTTYRAGTHSLTDVVTAYDALRRHHPTATICVWGASAGGNLALLLAERRRSVDCVITEGAPTDLVSFVHEPAYAPPGVPPTTGPQWLFDTFVISNLGQQNLERFSPVHAKNLHTPVLMASSTRDELVPQAQMADMKHAAPKLVQTRLLPGADDEPGNFTHAGVTPTALAAWHRLQLEFLKRAASREQHSSRAVKPTARPRHHD